MLLLLLLMVGLLSSELTHLVNVLFFGCTARFGSEPTLCCAACQRVARVHRHGGCETWRDGMSTVCGALQLSYVV